MDGQIGQIIRLDEGFVLTVYGRNYVATDPVSLGKLVTKLTKKRPKHAGTVVAFPEAPPVMPGTTGGTSPTVPENGFQGKIPQEMPLDWETQRAKDDRNLGKLIAARLQGEIDGEDLMRGARNTITTYEMQEVADIVLQAEQQYFRQADTRRRDGLLGPKCSCAQCPQNVSAFNSKGMCVSCYAGDHMHPGGDNNGQEGARATLARAEAAAQGQPGSSQREDEEDDDWDDDDPVEAEPGDHPERVVPDDSGDDPEDGGPTERELPGFERDASEVDAVHVPGHAPTER